jgi:HPt (histidine-containing phosphotransfer) domain-containing protein
VVDVRNNGAGRRTDKASGVVASAANNSRNGESPLVAAVSLEMVDDIEGARVVQPNALEINLDIGGEDDRCPMNEEQGISQAGSLRIYKSMVNRFKAYFPEMILKIKNAHAARDLPQLHAEVHSLKGSAGYAAATMLCEVASVLHECANPNAPYQNEADQMKDVDDSFKDLIREAAKVQRYLSSMNFET